MAPKHILINTVEMSHERSSSSMGGTDKWVRSGFCKCNDVVRVHPIRVPNERFARLPIKESHRLLSLCKLLIIIFNKLPLTTAKS